MDEIYGGLKSGAAVERLVGTNFNAGRFPSERTLTNPFVEFLLAEGGENFVYYLKWFGLLNEPYMLVLSSKRNYYYDCDYFKGLKTLVNLKKLNLIMHLDSFLHIVNNALSPKTYFAGCFYDNSALNRARLPEGIFKSIMNSIDSKVFIEIGKDEVSVLMRSHGFSVIDMTEINGITYFITQNTNDKSI
jgi:hypothetical protein